MKAMTLIAAIMCFTLGTTAPFVQAITPEHKAQSLSELFAKLAQSKDKNEARKHEHAIFDLWVEHPDYDATVRMKMAMQARKFYLFSRTIEILDGLATDYPDWAEVYNQRAAAHFHLFNFDAALADIDRALELEPRHFGALAGRGMIRYRQGREKQAYRNIQAAMKFHPYLREGALLPAEMRKTAGTSAR